MTPEQWEAKKENRIIRMRELARKSRERAENYDRSFRSISDHIPLGQPILIGHHSEGRHRRDIERMHRYTDKSIEEYQKAKYYDRRAASAESNNVISSDDPEAVKKLQAKLESLQKNQELMKAANKIIRKGKSPETIAALVALGFSESFAAARFEPDFIGRVGYADFELTNNNANMSRIKQRIASLQRAETAPEKETEVNGVLFLDSPAANRFQVFFPGKPAENIRSTLKHRGFRWSPTSGAWQRHRKNAWHNQDDIAVISALVAPAEVATIV